MVKVTYDSRYGQVHICLQTEKRARGCVAMTKEIVTDAVFADYLADGSLYGIEILGLGPIEFENLSYDTPVRLLSESDCDSS